MRSGGCAGTRKDPAAASTDPLIACKMVPWQGSYHRPGSAELTDTGQAPLKAGFPQMYQGQVHSNAWESADQPVRRGNIIVALDQVLTGQAQSQDVVGGAWAE